MRPLVVLLVVLFAASTPTTATTGDEPSLLIRIVSSVTLTDVTLEIDNEDDELVHTRSIRVEPGESAIEVALEPATYFVRLSANGQATSKNPFELLLGGESFVGQSASMLGCPGATAVDFTVTAQGMGTAGSGCMALTSSALALLDEARAAKSGASLASFEIPAPGSADRGVMGGTLFEWRGEASFLDAWGAPTDGLEVRYLSTGLAHYSSEDPVTGVGASAEVDGTVEVLRYLPGATVPHAWSSTLPGFGASSSATSASVTIEREVRYDEPWFTFACGLRNGLQGRTLHPGDEVASRDVCFSWDGPSFRAAAPIKVEGYRLLPLYQLEESSQRTLVSAVYLLDGVPYPIAMSRHDLPAGGFLREAGTGLERYQSGGDPIARASRPEAPRSGALAPLDPLHGPALGPVGSRLAFPLADAADAAISDPTLRNLAAVLARSDAALIGAAYGLAQDEGSPIAMQRWLLVFAAEDAAPVPVLCERPATELPLPPPARCRDEMVMEMTGLIDPLSGAMPMGRSDLPARAPTFAEAIARWDATRGSSDDPLTFAVYRAWADDDRAGFLAVGAGVAEPLTPADGNVAGSADHVALDLASGRTLASVQVEQRGASLSTAPLATVGPASLRASDAPFVSPETIPLVVGGGAALILLALALLLYSRLARSRVLDHETRAQIHDLVEREPGIHSRALLERLGKNSGVGEYHLGVLVREGFLTTLVSPGFTRYFVAGTLSPVAMRSQAVLREGQNEKLLSIIRAQPGIGVGELAVAAGVSMPYASKGVAKLVDAGLVRTIRDGRAVKLHENAAASA